MPASASPSLTPMPLDRFIREVEGIADRPDVAAHVAALLPGLLADSTFLERRYREPSSERYRQHIVHVDPAGRFSIVALVWAPGQATPIHDHIAWCVVGVLEGEERETRYAMADAARGLVRRQSVRHHHPRDVTWFVPEGPNIHRVENPGQDIAISIHVYGADIAKAGNSIARIYEEIVTPPSAPPA